MNYVSGDLGSFLMLGLAQNAEKCSEPKKVKNRLFTFSNAYTWAGWFNPSVCLLASWQRIWPLPQIWITWLANPFRLLNKKIWRRLFGSRSQGGFTDLSIYLRELWRFRSILSSAIARSIQVLMVKILSCSKIRSDGDFRALLVKFLYKNTMAKWQNARKIDGFWGGYGRPRALSPSSDRIFH